MASYTITTAAEWPHGMLRLESAGPDGVLTWEFLLVLDFI
jgi:hypothetical protein